MSSNGSQIGTPRGADMPSPTSISPNTYDQADGSTFAHLYPDQGSFQAFSMISEHPAAIQSYVPGLLDDSRESTAPPEQDDSIDALPYIPLKLSEPPKRGRTFVFGTDKTTCDFILAAAGISGRHFSIGLDDNGHRLVIKDLGSRYGTSVRCGEDEPVHHCKDKTWIVSGEDAAGQAPRYIINIPAFGFLLIIHHIKFQSLSCSQYLDRFLAGASMEERLDDLGIQSVPPTTHNTGINTPVSSTAFVVKKALSSRVAVVLDVASGNQFVRRQLPTALAKHRRFEHADILKQFVHHHLCRYLYFPYAQSAQAHLEDPFTVQECWQILYQMLAALSYLHFGSTPWPFFGRQQKHDVHSLIHGHVGPSSILVFSRSQNSIEVKLSDIQASIKDITAGPFTAPERYDTLLEPTQAVDIWSLGATILVLLKLFPPMGDSASGRIWTERIVEQVNGPQGTIKGPSDLDDVLRILKQMLVSDPRMRSDAAQCWSATHNLIWKRTPTPSVISEAPSLPATMSPGPGTPTAPSVVESVLQGNMKAPLPRGYQLASFDKRKVAYDRSAKLVNAAHLVKLLVEPPPQEALRRFRKAHPDVKFRIAKKVHPQHRGTYIPFEAIGTLWKYFDSDKWTVPLDVLRRTIGR
ncbi:kinase-like domain-containing protein [Triangularia verruculosa]|uniref:non-specific serine/threonine protein kinase n=1 Tax=Triangularia verruculosa TaxID=2587418 RepID=A0AAN7AZN0_9PEZI|nr:kinase-like domain-containing protein [Triangularia verruculosa]